MTRRRPLSDEEKALWSGFVRSIKPLRGVNKLIQPTSAADDAAPPSKPHQEPPRPVPPPKPAPLAPLDRRFKQRVARGRAGIDARLDLHGFTQREAYAELLHFLSRAQVNGHKVVLVVTGKGAGQGSGDLTTERGVLRRQVPMWLALPAFRPLIIGFDEAHGGHGGQGALYVRVRRQR